MHLPIETETRSGMAIPLAGCFHYTTVIREQSAGAWRGRAQPAPDDSRHPGLAGDQPEIALVEGVVTLTRMESESSLRNNPHYQRFRVPSPLVKFRIGEALERVVRPGDTLSVFRFGTGDLGATLLREERLLIGLGFIGSRPAPHVIIEEDPRAQEVMLYDIVRALDDPEVTVCWLDVADPDLEAKVRAFEESQAPRQVVALAGRDEDGRRALSDRLFGHPGRHYPWLRSRRTEFVQPRFRTQREWTEYLRSLPKTRPADLWIRFTIERRFDRAA